jgi:hypothetical protein
MANLEDLMEEYKETNKLYNFEGERGLGNLNKILKAIGYKGHQFLYGSPIESFLSDNPGAIDAMLEWIAEQDIEEWRDEITTHLPEEDWEG